MIRPGSPNRGGSEQPKRDSAVKSLTKALDLLNYMGRRRHPVGVTELANEMDLNKSVVHRLLQTMEASGFVTKDPATHQYFLGSRLFVLGKVFENTVALRGLARPVIERLAQQMGEAVHLMVPAPPEDGLPSLLLLDKIEATYQLTITPNPGAVSPAHCTAGGKVLLAFGMENALDRLQNPLPRHTVRTITDLAALRAELAHIQAAGYAVDDQELEVGLTCVAAPVFDGDKAVAALSVSGPSIRLTSERLDVARRAVIAAAAEIHNLLS